MPNFLWTLLYFLVALWAISRIVAWCISITLKKYLGVQIKFGKVGLFNFGNVHITIKKGLKIEVSQIWLSSTFVNPEVRKLLVLCIRDVRIQADVLDVPGGQGATTTRPPANATETRQKDLTKIMAIAQVLGIRIENLTVMILNTVIPFCLIHIAGQEMFAEFGVEKDSCLLSVTLNGMRCKALRSVDGESDSSSPRCLGEFSFGLSADIKTDRKDPTKLNTLRVLYSKPQMMITEGFLYSLQSIRLKHNASTAPNLQRPPTQKFDIQKFDNLKEVNIDFTELNLKIVRERKQRSLSISVKLFHVGLLNEATQHNNPNMSCKLVLEEFSTSSPQAHFAELTQLGVKSEVVKNVVGVQIVSSGGFFHYHHEEVQYWLLVFLNIGQGETSITTPVTPKTNPSDHSALFYSLTDDKRITVEIELSDMTSVISKAACSGFHVGLQNCKMAMTLKPGLKGPEFLLCKDKESFKSHDVNCELEIGLVRWCHTDSIGDVKNLNLKKHYWDHVLYLGLLLLKVVKVSKVLNVEVMMDNLQLEWSTETVNVLLNLIGAIRKTHLPRGEKHSKMSLKPSLISNYLLSVKCDVSNLNIFLCNDHKVFLMLRVDSIWTKHKPDNSTIAVNGAKLVYHVQSNIYLSLLSSAELSSYLAHVKEIRGKFIKIDQAVQIQIRKELYVVWTTHCHMCLNQAIQDAMLLKRSLRGHPSPRMETPPPPEQPVPVKRQLSIDVLINAKTDLSLRLSQGHSVSLITDNILLSASEASVALDVKHFIVKFDGHKIFNIKGMVAETLSPYVLLPERKTVGCLELETNRAWGFFFECFDVVFPFKYNFAVCFEEIVNFIKWVKLVHHIKKKEFTENSKLPPDLKIKTKSFSVQLSDDPFEVKIGDNYELLKDEGEQNETRRQLLDRKIDEKQKAFGHITLKKREELYSSLAKRSAEVYIQRSQQLYSSMPMRNQLFTWQMEELQIIALADQSYHGKDNAVKQMREIDAESCYPAEGLEFSTLWCRTVNVSISSWVVTLRDYPQPMLDVQDMLLWGRLVAAEQEGSKRAKRSSVVEVQQPWGDVTVERNLPPLKFFHDFSCDIALFTIAYGVCWEPAVALFNNSMDLINQPSTDPSMPLPFWDKARLLLHGRLTMSIQKMSWQYHASFDPYNTTELMDWSWTNVIVDWTNAKWVLKGDLDIHARTASKYDDCKLFHLPNLRFCVRLEWLCLGDPNDHHAVSPCAPDKVPDYSMEKHDSFRAFRSENLNLDISLDIRAAEVAEIPSCKFYASSLRFLDKIKNCMFSVTRPVRRGNLFNTQTQRKPQLTRHYKKIKLHVNFHQFSIWYWMSFSNPNGAELLSDSFVMHMCNKLILVPIEDGLLHRPSSNWSIKYLNCELGTTKTWLCKFGTEKDRGNISLRNPLDKSFFMSIARISYQRSDNSKDAERKKLNSSDSDVYLHSVKISDMKGAWTKKNRSVIIALYEGYQKNNTLRRNLSSDALKGFKVEGNLNGSRSRNSSNCCFSPTSSTAVATTETPSPLTRLQSGTALTMLMKLVAESDSQSIAFTEEPSSTNMDQLHGIQACHTGEVLLKKWFISLYNSQVLLKGSETNGYVIVSAHKANIQSNVCQTVWCDSHPRSKTTWEADVDCMQYYATVDPRQDFDDDNIPWLLKENVELPKEHERSSVTEMVGSGHQVGGIVNVQTRKKSIQLQRIISRCRCQVFYASYGEVENDTMPEVPMPPDSEETDMMKIEEGVDTVTLLHHDLMMSSNTLQYTVILDIVNNLLLYIEPKEKEANEKLQSMRFKLLLSRVEDQKTPILQLQENVREHLQMLRKLERELYLVHKTLDECFEDQQLSERSKLLELQVNNCKRQIFHRNEELAMRISCYKESHLQVKAQMKTERAHQAHVVRLNEVCFKFANWRLTDKDGQIGITDISLRNFVYSKTNRDDDTWTHQLEVGWFKVENLLRNTIYRDVLEPCDSVGKDGRQMALRIFCSERPPVGGIAVKEHFEVNVVPLNIQMTYQFYEAVMGFFFPDKNIEVDDDEDDVEGSKKKSSKEKKEKESVKKPATTSSDDIDKMKERAANNNTFIYIKIPEVTLRVSYKGQKEKNIIDVHDFSFVLPTAEYHNEIWTWFDFLIALKNHSKRTLVSQAIKQKLHMKTRVGDEHLLTDVQQEEDKAKMLLGAKLLAGQEKPPKKTLFGKQNNP